VLWTALCPEKAIPHKLREPHEQGRNGVLTGITE
jgi:hypothetical protein